MSATLPHAAPEWAAAVHRGSPSPDQTRQAGARRHHEAHRAHELGEIMAQHYSQPVARERMAHNLCPECGGPVATHSNDLRFWMPRACDLTAVGVEDRIAQYRAESVTA